MRILDSKEEADQLARDWPKVLVCPIDMPEKGNDGNSA